jgi:hypothetical protein
LADNRSLVLRLSKHFRLAEPLRTKIHAFFDSVVFCDVNYYAIVGAPALLERGEDPVSALTEILKLSPQLEALGTFTEALFATGNNVHAIALNAP